jgi:hypothetical protein
VAAALLAVALTITGTANPWSRRPPLEAEAAELTGAAPVIVCETSVEHEQGVMAGKTSYYGFTMMTRPKLVVFAPFICQSLRQRKLDSAEFAHAVFVFAHELGHVALDTKDETAAECYALDNWRRLGVLLGLGKPTPEQESAVSRAHERLPLRYRGTCTREGSDARR